jgi:hypothetical protein
MDEAEWLASNDPMPMLGFLEGKASDRKLRLFAAACCRRIWPWVAKASRDWPDAGPNAVDAVERFADGQAGEEELQAAQEAAGHAAEAAVRGVEWRAGATAAAAAAAGRKSRWGPVLTPFAAAREAAGNAAWVETIVQWTRALEAMPEGDVPPAADHESPRMAQAALLRDLFASPFRPPVIDSVWLSGNDGTVAKLAQAIYQERSLPAGTLDPARLAVLSDALEDAGCGEQAILDHLRSPGPHVRGCWVVDSLLGLD